MEENCEHRYIIVLKDKTGERPTRVYCEDCGKQLPINRVVSFDISEVQDMGYQILKEIKLHYIGLFKTQNDDPDIKPID